MDEVQMQDAVDRYLRMEMSGPERALFEELRRTNPEVDQLVVSHSYFIQELEKYGQLKEFKSSLNAVEAELIENGSIQPAKLTGRARVVTMWNRYKRTIAVAACIGGVTALCISGIMMSLNHKPDATVLQLVRKVDDMARTNRAISQQLNEVKTKVNPKAELKGSGTSFLIDGRGYLVTNAHVISGVSSVIVRNLSGEDFKTKIVFVNPAQDLAILKIDDSDWRSPGVLPYGIKRSGAELGEPLYTLGYPRNEIVYNQGYLSAKSGFEGDSSSWQITISANPGNSGGPVLNDKGEVIGILSTKQLQADGAVFALRSKNIYMALDSLRRDTVTNYPSIHVSSISTIRTLPREQQIKKIAECVYMVKGY